MEEHVWTVEDEIRDVKMSRPHVVILGAGASLAAFKEGDKYGRRLPLMNNLIEVLELGPELDKYDIPHQGKNFEDIYCELHGDKKYVDLVKTMEDRVFAYFSELHLPDRPTMYDHLVLSLREKDIIATFNWDPFLFQAGRRNYGHVSLPQIVYLHGNVALGHCMDHRQKGYVDGLCNVCGRPFLPSRLLYPVKEKNYTDDPFINAEWNALRGCLKSAYVLTIFGYSAPTSDVEAVSLMKQAWGNVEDRNLEEVEIIGIKKEDKLVETWKGFIHTDHCTIHNDFYDCFIAKHPRRTCDAMWNQLMEVKFIEDNNIPKDYDFERLWKWYEPLREVEERQR
jgi:hypothetical protein